MVKNSSSKSTVSVHLYIML